MKPVTRRDFLKSTTLAGVALPLAARAQSTPATNPIGGPRATDGPPRLHWLSGTAPSAHAGTAWGVAWPRGVHGAETSFALSTADGVAVPVQSWATAYWPDGSLKWTGHAISSDAPASEAYVIDAGTPETPARPVRVSSNNRSLTIDTGVIRCRLPRSGNNLIRSIERDGRTILENGCLTGSRQDTPEPGAEPEAFTSTIESASVEQDGPVRAVIKVTGMHRTGGGREWLPFTVRLYFHAGSDAVRMTHTFIFDGDEETDFISALGVRFSVPMRDELYNRHVRFAGEERGLWAEAVQGLTGLRRDAGADVRRAQVAGKGVPPIDQWAETVSSRVHWIPAWGDYTLAQPNANGFTVRKRTKEGHAWVPADQGRRASGLGYIGGVSGGVAFGMRDFWQLHPTQLDVRHAHTDAAEVTLWMWSPDARPMDIRFYHDGLGQETYEQQLDALNITYEDYEPGFGTPHGVARSTDLTFWALASTPDRDHLANLAEAVQSAPQLVARPEDYLKAEVFGALWSLPDTADPAKAEIEKRLAWSVDYYTRQVEQRHWYGFWDFGDVMHTYDHDRHVWRYDVGGYAWDNSELSPDLWLWYSFLRTGNLKDYRLAEAMARHTRDVDIYHLGRFAGLGTRHNVQHWGCSAKQLRISTAANRRFHYFITTDERTGDVLNEVIEADRQLGEINPVRKIAGQPFRVEEARIGVGTDWGAAAANWLTAWERTGDAKYRQWLVEAMETIGGHELGFFVGTFAFDPETKKLTPPENARPSLSHLNAVFGLFEICAELIQLLDIPEFKRAWLQYCRLYNAPAEEQAAALGRPLRGNSLRVGHSRLTAYAALMENDPALAKRAWNEFSAHEWGPRPTVETHRIEGPEVLNPVDEAAWVSTNDSAQWGLAAIQNLALVSTALGS